MEDPRIISALFIFLKMAYYNVLINIYISFVQMCQIDQPPNRKVGIVCTLMLIQVQGSSY